MAPGKADASRNSSGAPSLIGGVSGFPRRGPVCQFDHFRNRCARLTYSQAKIREPFRTHGNQSAIHEFASESQGSATHEFRERVTALSGCALDYRNIRFR